MVDLCRALLDMTVVGKHGQAKILNRSVCNVIPQCKVEFLDSQVNGAVFMLQRTLGSIPVATKFADDAHMRGIAAKLKSVQTHGGIVVDTMGFGKTYTALLFAAYHAAYAPHTGTSGKPVHRPILCIVPAGVVLQQWQDAIKDKFLSLNIIVAHGERPNDAKLSMHWVSAMAVRDYPQSLKNWPKHLRYIFDPTNPKASQTIILSSYDTFAQRTLKVTKQQKRNGQYKKIYTSSWQGVFDIVIMDEGHKLRHPFTKTYASIKMLKANVHWFLTATPVINDSMVSASSSWYE